MIDYSILAMSMVCAGTALALGITLYKPAEDARPPFPRARFGGNVIPPTRAPRGIVVEFSDGRAAVLPALDGAATRFEKLLSVHAS